MNLHIVVVRGSEYRIMVGPVGDDRHVVITNLDTDATVFSAPVPFASPSESISWAVKYLRFNKI